MTTAATHWITYTVAEKGSHQSQRDQRDQLPNIPDSPCKVRHCEHQAQCSEKLQACDAFYLYTRSKPFDTSASIPSREWFNKMNKGD